MASDRTRELAKAELLNKLSTAAALFAMEYNAAHEAGGYLNHGLDSVLKPIIDIALDAFERETRLDEVLQMPCPGDCKSNFGLGTLPCDCHKSVRITGLAAQPTPEVEK